MYFIIMNTWGHVPNPIIINECLTNLLFRFIVIKYANRGLAQTGGLSSTLFNKLYFLLTASVSFSTCLMYLVKLWRHMNGTFNEEHFLLVRPFRSREYVSKPPIIIFVFTFLTCMTFFSVQYLKKSKAGFKMKIQRNIVTFNTNFYFLISFSLLTLITNLLKSKALTRPWIVSWMIFVKLMSILFVGFLRPVIIIYLLRNNRPDFFEDREENLQTETTFYISGHSLQPRQQIFCSYKSFRQDARWGWMNERFRIRAENASISHQINERTMNSMPRIDI